MPRIAFALTAAIAALLAVIANIGSTSAASSVKIAAAGDIACPPGYTVTARTCQQGATARLISSNGASAVLPLGDLQYDAGSLTGFNNSYDRNWGAYNAKAYPVPGNHEYGTSGAAGYFKYFSSRAHGAPGYYAYDIGAWRVYALNSNCLKINCTTEASWLGKDLAANPNRCVLAYMHHPRYSSSSYGGTLTVNRFWTKLLQAKADVVLAGHSHNYERFAPMNSSGGSTSTGIRSFVVGTGGKSLYAFGATAPGSQFRYKESAGVLFMTLNDSSYSWSFKTINGTVRDSGSASCA